MLYERFTPTPPQKKNIIKYNLIFGFCTDRERTFVKNFNTYNLI